MRYKIFGNSGLRVSELCLGTMTFGEEWGWGSSKETSREVYEAFLDAGGNFVDTANVYTEGTSEEFLGEFMEGHRERIVLATKYTNASPGEKPVDPNAAGNHRKSMMQAVEGSLRRLRTDYIDLYWVHIWDRVTPIDEVMRALDDLVRQGKVLYVGISDAPAWWVSRANTMAELRGWSAFLGIQVAYSLLERTPERELIPMAENLGLGVTAWSPLASGVLTGKYRDGADGDGAGALLRGHARPDRSLRPTTRLRRPPAGRARLHRARLRRPRTPEAGCERSRTRSFGPADRLTVLDAQRTLRGGADRLARSEVPVTLRLLGLYIYKALGGGSEVPE